MCKYLLSKPNKDCAEIPNSCHNIAVSLGDAFFGAPCIYNIDVQFINRANMHITHININTNQKNNSETLSYIIHYKLTI